MSRSEAAQKIMEMPMEQLIAAVTSADPSVKAEIAQVLEVGIPQFEESLKTLKGALTLAQSDFVVRK